jgi:hypothetical protein
MPVREALKFLVKLPLIIVLESAVVIIIGISAAIGLFSDD